ncbi:hypothetical protein BH23VER1_BH23VER1_01610 [soil metagenome]
MKKHEWRDRFEDGTARRVRATHHGGRWAIHEQAILARSMGDQDSRAKWRALEPVPLRDLQELRDLLWRKYQRRRATFAEIEAVDAMIGDLGEGAD